MHCPKCKQPLSPPALPCPHCHFNSNSQDVENWNHIRWLLTEVETWEWLYQRHRETIRKNYLTRQKALEVELGLRLPPFSEAEVAETWPKLLKFEILREKLGAWLEQGWLEPDITQAVVDQTGRELDELLERLEEQPRPAVIPTDWERLSLVNFLIESADSLDQQKAFVTFVAKDKALAPLLAEQEELELKLGLRPEPIPEVIEPEHEPEVVPPPPPEPVPPVEMIPEPVVTLPAEPAPPPVPFRERLWQMLLSERALQGMLVLGIFLLFSAALSFVAWGWKDFSAPFRVLIPTGFTGMFFGFGWYVRTRTPMYRSGMALSAIAALLIPIDFYTLYVNFHIPDYYWPLFWLGTSVFCLVAYIGATLMIRSRFFGYLVGTAAGSTVLALIELGHQYLGLSTDWQSTGLSGLALALLILATSFAPPGQTEERQNPLLVFTEPFRYLSLLAISVIMLLTFGWRFTQREGYDTLHYALTVNWWLGGFIFGWGAIHYRSRGLGLLAAMTLPGATYLAQAALFHQGGISPAWHAFGWALLIPLYFIVGYKLLGSLDPVTQSHGRVSIRWGVFLLGLAALWPLTNISNGTAASASHVVLVGAVVLAALLWQRPAYLYGASLFSFTAATFAMTELNLTLAQLSVGWVSLAILHIILALNLGTRFPIPLPSFATPLVNAGYFIAALALIPPLFPYQGGVLAYTLANWLALAAWGAYLAHLKQPGFTGSGVWRKPVFQWLTSLPLPVWLWVLFLNRRPPDGTLLIALAALAWAMILLSYRLRRIEASYRWPWYLTGLAITLIAPALAFLLLPNSFAPALVLLPIGLLYLADAISRRQSLELAPGALVTSWGYLLLLDRLHLSPGAVHFGLALLIAGYFLYGLGTERRKVADLGRKFFQPLYLSAHLLTFLLLIFIYTPLPDRLFLDIPWLATTRLWGAASQLLLALIYGLFTWVIHKERWGHVSTWLGAGGLVFLGTVIISTPSALTGHLAIVASAFILLERSLYSLRRRSWNHNRQRVFFRFTWRLYHRPLFIAGWIISAGAIGVSLFYNIGELAGNRPAETWAVAALLLVTGLYGLSARWYKQVQFVWLAGLLSFVPWTLLTHLGWWILPSPSLATYIFSWAILAWLHFSIQVRLKQVGLPAYALPLRTTVHGLLLLCLGWSLLIPETNEAIFGLGLLAAGLLYFTEAGVNRQFLALVPGGLVTAWGCFRLVEQFTASFDALTLSLTFVVALYVLTGLWIERKKLPSFDHQFFTPLYLTSHGLAVLALGRVYLQPFNELFFNLEWTDEMRLWGAAAQLMLSLVYGLYAWSTYKERWGHVAAWLGAFSGGFIAISYSSGRGSSAAKAALLAIVFILAERGLYRLCQQPGVKQSYQAVIRRAWPLYRRPLLITGWVISGGAILLALVRNLWLLEGGRTQQIWSTIALLLIVGLYALSARLFRQARFLWLAAPLSFAPWTLLTHLGWFTPYRVTLPGYALSWTILALGLLLVGLALKHRGLPRYAQPLAVVAQGLMPFALLWGSVDIETSRFTLPIAIGFYGLCAWLDYKKWQISQGYLEVLRQTKYLYPALGFLPVWSLYLLAWLFPAAQLEAYGLLLLLFGPLGIMGGRGLVRYAPQPQTREYYALPAYLTGYISLGIGTLLGIGQPALLALVLLYDALLMVISARVFKHPAWLYPAVIFAPLSLLLTLAEIGVWTGRYGWWLIGLASIYLALAWLLRRAQLSGFAGAPLSASFGLIALSLPFSSLDQTGALWGYGGAVVLYGITAFWLHQPLLLALASGLVAVPYAILIQRSELRADYFGLALLPGAVIALGSGWLLDRYYGVWKDFPWNSRSQWLKAVVERLLGWWAFPLYTLGLSLALVSPFLVQFKSGLMSLAFLGQALLWGWAVYRFRLRGWLAGATVAVHFSLLFAFQAWGWWGQLDVAQAWLRFLPLPLSTLTAALLIGWYRREAPLSRPGGQLEGWSEPLYIIFGVDIMLGQMLSFSGAPGYGMLVTLIHALSLVLLASFWLSPGIAYLSTGLMTLSLTQWVFTRDNLNRDFPIALAGLAFLFGFIGYGLALLRANLQENRELRPWLGIWELPLQRSSLLLSFGTLFLATVLGVDLGGWIIRALLGLPFQQIVELDTVRMMVGVLEFLGLLYLVAALAHQWPRLGYLAMGMLLTAWALYILFIQQLAEFRQIHWYVVPAGLYLAGIAYMEWQAGNKQLARWLDYTTIVTVLGTLFWQTLLFGWGHALLLGGIGLAAFFWGVGRRLRRFLYTGMVATMLATIGQLVNSFWSINQWIVFGLVGVMLILMAIIVERKLEDIKLWQEILETWE